VPLVEQELLSLSEQLSVFSGVRVARSLVWSNIASKVKLEMGDAIRSPF
jgi:hypothetical protein